MIYKHLLNFWPLVPAVDILTMYDTLKANCISSDDLDIPFEEYQKKVEVPSSVGEDKSEMDIVIIADGMGCLFKTLARLQRHTTTSLNIYVVSCFPESLSRVLLLLFLFCETLEGMGTLEKAEIFLEIFGNTALRASTAAFVETKSTQLLEDISSEASSLQSMPMVSTKLLKQVEKDAVCKVLSFLKQYDLEYDVAKAWDTSLRAYYGTRYDSRRNIFDYLYNMRLSHYPVIGLQNYLEWSESGVAYKLRKARYDHPNKTLCVKTTFPSAGSVYCGDIATSPYIAFGVECKEEKLFEKANNQYKHSSEDISKFNIIDYMAEASSRQSSEKSVTIHVCMYSTFMKARRFKQCFDVVYVTCDMMSCATNGMVKNVLKDDGVAIFETIQNVVNSTKDQKTKHYEEIDRIAKSNGLSEINNWESNGCFKTYTMNGSNTDLISTSQKH